jgi:hypothetical protein
MQAILGQHIYFAAKGIFQIGQQTSWKERASVRSDIDQKIDITVRAGLAARDRAEHAYIGRAVSCSDLQDFLAFDGQQFSGGHRFTSMLKIIA